MYWVTKKDSYIQCYVAMWTMLALPWVCMVGMVAKTKTHEHSATLVWKITFNNKIVNNE